MTEGFKDKVAKTVTVALIVVIGVGGAVSVWPTYLRGKELKRQDAELTHAMWGVAFGARPSKLRVSGSGGSVNLTKTNMLITLAPYFFPFYTFVVVAAALATLAFVRPLPFLPLWMFMIGFTWAFHVLFTIETLSREQPDVQLYGRVFSWVFIFLANAALVLAWLAAATPLTFRELGGFLAGRTASSYLCVGSAILSSAKWIRGAFAADASGGA